MTLLRRTILGATGTAGFLWITAARAQKKLLRMIARTIGPVMQAKLDMNYVVDNKAGASGMIGMGVVAKSTDPGTLLIVPATAVTLPFFYKPETGILNMKLFAAISLMCASVFPSLSHAQDYPSHAIHFIVPYTPGTTADVLARLLGPKISQRWNIPVVVENMTGASGIIGTSAVAKAAPDGYTFLFAATSYSALAAINPRLPYDPVESFTPVSLLGTSTMTLVLNNKFPASNVQEFIDQIKKQPGVVNYASPGTGSSQHLAMELFKQETGMNLVHVPYKGTAGALNDIIAGHVQASVVSLQSATPFARSGNLRMLAVMGRERVPTFPEVPTLAELGFDNMLVEAWYGVMAPAGTPPPMIAKMNTEIDLLLTLPELKKAMAKQGVDPVGGKPEKLDTLLQRELKMWKRVVARGKIVVD